jgi:hypothetical protein
MKFASNKVMVAIAATALAPALLAGTAFANDKGRGNNPGLGEVYVESQGLYYDTFKTTDLNGVGRFQPLNPTDGPHGGASTPYGPGDQGYVGGRWWVDTDMDGEMDEGDTYFSCPLLGPGRTQSRL